MLNKLNNKWPITLAAGFILIAGIALGLTYSLSASPDVTSVALTSPQGSKENPHEIVLTNERKEPIDMVISSGDYIQFNSKDGKDHQILQGAATEDHAPSPSPLDSGIIKDGKSYLLQFNKTGKYEFHDNYNHNYTITVLVYDPGKSA